VGAHRTGRKVWALGRFHRLNQALEALVVTALIAAAAFAGWVSFQPASAPGSVLNQPHAPPVASRPTDPPVPPVPAALLGHGHADPAPPPARKKVSTTKKAAPAMRTRS
jgi:hypothetical protein